MIFIKQKYDINIKKGFVDIIITEKDGLDFSSYVQLFSIPRKGEYLIIDKNQYHIIDIIHHYSQNKKPYIEIIIKKSK